MSSILPPPGVLLVPGGQVKLEEAALAVGRGVADRVAARGVEFSREVSGVRGSVGVGGADGMTVDLDITDLDRLHADLLIRTPSGKGILTAAHEAMAIPVAKRIRRYAPVDRTPPRSSASERYGPLSRNVTITADDTEAIVSSPFYARFQDSAAYIWAAYYDALPEAQEAFAEVIQRHVNRPGGGFFGVPGGRVAGAGRAAVQIALGVILYQRGKVIGRFLGRSTAGALQAAPFSGVAQATRLGTAASSAVRAYRGERGVLRATRLERAARRTPFTASAIAAGEPGSALVGAVYGRKGAAAVVRRAARRIQAGR